MVEKIPKTYVIVTDEIIKHTTAQEPGGVEATTSIDVTPHDIEEIGENQDITIDLEINLGNFFTEYSSAGCTILVKKHNADLGDLNIITFAHKVTSELQWLAMNALNDLAEKTGRPQPFQLPPYEDMRSGLLDEGMADVELYLPIKMAKVFGDFTSLKIGVGVKKSDINLSEHPVKDICEASTSRQGETVMRSMNRISRSAQAGTLFDVGD